MSANTSYSSIAAEREDMESTLAFAREITQEFDNMAGQSGMDNAEIAALSKEMAAMGSRGPVNRGSVGLSATLQDLDQSMAKQKALAKEMVDAAANFARELIKWAEDLEQRESQENSTKPERALVGSPVVTLFDRLSAAIVAAPLEAAPWRDRGIDGRRGLLAGEAFPGASEKSMIRVDLLDGRRLEGKSAGYCAALELWTTDGIQRIDLLALPDDLRRCFEDEAEGKYLALLRECATVLDNATADSGKMARKVEDFIEATNLRVEGVSDDVAELEADLHHTFAENAALQEENARLRAELEKLRQ